MPCNGNTIRFENVFIIKIKNMKKNLVILMTVMIGAMLFAGCGEAASPSDTATSPSDTVGVGAVEGLSGFVAAQQKIAATYDPNDPAAAAKMMESYAEYGAQLELQEFEKAEAVDAPIGFPESLIYNGGKITESSDDGDETYINKSITIKTTEDVKTVREFYKNLFSQAPWKITSQSSESGGASYGAKDAANLEASVDISSDTYSKLVNIYVWYSGDITE